MSRENTSSVDMKNGKILAHTARIDLANMKRTFSSDEKEVKEQIVNARKKVSLAKKKAKAKKRAKMAKVSKKKNKK